MTIVLAGVILPGEVVQFSWTGPTHGTMDALPTDSAGNTAHGGIVEDPPGNYTIVVQPGN